MSWLPRIQHAIRSRFKKGRVDAEMDEEMGSHVEMRRLPQVGLACACCVGTPRSQA